MALAAASLLHTSVERPAEFAEVAGQQNSAEQSGGARAATHAQWDFVVDAQMEGQDGFACMGEHIAVGVQDEIVFGARAEVGIAASRLDGEVRPREV
jgi:hypothetical protein